MKKILLLLALTATATGAFSQTDNTSVLYVAYWSVGDSYDFRVRRTSMVWDDDSLIQNDISEYIANFRVVDSSSTSYTVAWTYPNELLNNWDLSGEMIYELSKYRQRKVVYTTTQLGQLIGIKNWEEQAENIRSMTDDILSLLAKDPDTDFEKSIEKAQTFLEKYGTKEVIENMVMPELKLFHSLFGANIPVRDTIRYEEKLTLMAGDKPVRVDTKIWFEDVDFRKQRSILIQESASNRDDTKVLLREIYYGMGFGSADIKKAMAECFYSLDTFDRYDFRYNPGVPVIIYSSKKVRVDLGDVNNHSEEAITIELL